MVVFMGVFFGPGSPFAPSGAPRRLRELACQLALLLMLEGCKDEELTPEPVPAEESPPELKGSPARHIDLEYEVEFPALAGQEDVDLYVPLIQSGTAQKVLKRGVATRLTGQVEREARFGNEFWHAHLKTGPARATQLKIRYSIERQSVESLAEPQEQSTPPAAHFLEGTDRIPVGERVLNRILEKVDKASRSKRPKAVARAIYDYVRQNVQHSTAGIGWGHGDTYWAVQQRFGDCSDFHALFVSLARTRKVPARFHFGPLLSDKEAAGTIERMHSWAEYWAKDRWWSVDACLASQEPPDGRNFFGELPADRVTLSSGRDIRLGANHRGPPLNFFVTPYIEVAGEPWGTLPQVVVRYAQRPLEEGTEDE